MNIQKRTTGRWELFHRNDIPELGSDSFGGNADDNFVFDEALEEIIEIKNGADMERESKETKEDRFELEILKNKLDKSQENVKLINDIFGYKKFIITPDNNFLCKSYIDKVDLLLGYHIEFSLNWDEAKLDKLYHDMKDKIKNMEYAISGFKFYWNQPKIYLYENLRHSSWQNIACKEDAIRQSKKGIDEVINFIKLELHSKYIVIKNIAEITQDNQNPIALTIDDIQALHRSF